MRRHLFGLAAALLLGAAAPDVSAPPPPSTPPDRVPPIPPELLPYLSGQARAPVIPPGPAVPGLGLAPGGNQGLAAMPGGLCPSPLGPPSTLTPIFPPPGLTGAGGGSLYGPNYGENLGGGPGSTVAQSSAVLGTLCPLPGSVPAVPGPSLELRPPAPVPPTD